MLGEKGCLMVLKWFVRVCEHLCSGFTVFLVQRVLKWFHWVLYGLLMVFQWFLEVLYTS